MTIRYLFDCPTCKGGTSSLCTVKGAVKIAEERAREYGSCTVRLMVDGRPVCSVRYTYKGGKG